MTRQDAKNLSTEIMEAVKVVAARHGFTVNKGGVVFGEGSLKINNVQLTKTVSVGAVSRPAYVGESVFNNIKDLHGCGHVSMGEQYTEGSKVFELIGFKGNSPKFPILIKNISDGKTYKTTWASLEMHFRRR